MTSAPMSWIARMFGCESAAIAFQRPREIEWMEANAFDLLKDYFKIEDRDEPREIREKVTGKLLTLDESLKSTLPALLPV